MLSTMAGAFIKANTYSDLWAVAVDDDENGIRATGTVTLSGPCKTSGQIALMIAGTSVRVTALAGDTATAMARKIAAAVNALKTLPVTATSAEDKVTLTARWSGVTGNDIDIRVNYYDGDMLPAGVGCTCSVMTGGVGNPDLSDAIAAFGDTWWNYLVNPFTDTANLDLLKLELVNRWGPLRQIDGQCFMGFRGTHAATSTFGIRRNDYLFSTTGTGLVPQPPYIWAATVAGAAVASLSTDPARPLQTLQLPGLLPPTIGERWALNERNVLLYDGISTYSVAAGNVVQIERLITMYRENSFGDTDPSYLDVETIATLSYLRYSTRTRITQKFPRHKLASDGIRVSPGQAIVTPAVVKTELLALFTEHEWAGLVEGFDDYKATLIVERDENDRNRLNVRDNPDLVNQFRIYAHAIQFIL
ncbi:phage tail sheath subtilisin-like domain-containing protein [Erwinia tracheiphila]|nr:phage tail sheath subtilisin-like domain-containing protein [Erwinia tracheiphila]UIA93053.1 phage tail sheath subtilisin-like domain-containing protein [Erwinia tracheiphila]